ncbi:hypothetical protein NAS2_1073 [Conexivisphaera calida]|uniref:Uncharacterized protein n=1 Tax=Conexivisphaera calida TaxID=1874277 RepID=A0A4P2VGT3_9ARCH|nr:hypothetical protein NAS2_1073 [Conexivisphaera calida]
MLLMHVPIKVFEKPSPPGTQSDVPQFRVLTQSVVSFVNYGRRGSWQGASPGELKFVDVTRYVVHETEHAPWNEIQVLGRPEGFIIRLRVLLTKLEMAESAYNQFGDPIFRVGWQLILSVHKPSGISADLR